MTRKKIAVLSAILMFVCVGIFSIYKSTYKEEFNYVALGDSLAAGRNPYGVDDYGYNDYLKDYLKNENKLESYVSYAVSGYTILDVSNDINYNRIVNVDNKNIGIKKALRESDIVTISIGANDFLSRFNLTNISSDLSDINNTKSILDSILTDIDKLFKLIKQYAKKDIIVVGYYNPVPNMDKYKASIDNIIKYIDEAYNELCAKHNIYYVQISHKIKENNEYLPNPLDIHLSKEGYEIISKEIIKLIKTKVFN